jgi:small subunit ribosomal protein S4e
MPRGPKKHLKRLNAPSHWMLDKLGGIFVRPELPCQTQIGCGLH